MRQLKNYINGQWVDSTATESLEVENPATNEVLATVPLSPAGDVAVATEAAVKAFVDWRQTPVGERIQ